MPVVGRRNAGFAENHSSSMDESEKEAKDTRYPWMKAKKRWNPLEAEKQPQKGFLALRETQKQPQNGFLALWETQKQPQNGFLALWESRKIDAWTDFTYL